MGFGTNVYADVFLTEKEALELVFPEIKEIKVVEHFLTQHQKKMLKKKWKVKFHPEYDKNFKFYVGVSNPSIVGYAYIDTVKGKWGPITYIIRISTTGKVQNLAVINLAEKRGKPVREKSFLKQFIGKFFPGRLQIGRDIDAVTGATISSRAITNGVRKVLVLFNEFYRQKSKKEW